MGVSIIAPAAGSTVTTPVLVEWEFDIGSNVYTYRTAAGNYINVSSSDYTCVDLTCHMWLDLPEYESNSVILVYSAGSGNSGYRYFSVGATDETGGGQRPTTDPEPDPDPDPVPTGEGVVVVTLDTTALKTLLDSYFVVDEEISEMIVAHTLIMFAIGFGAAKVVSILSRS